MSHNTMISAIFLILALAMANIGFCEDKQQIELKLSIYPKTVAIGDTCYVLVTTKNHSNRIAGVLAPGFENTHGLSMVQFDLSRQEKAWCGTFECWTYEIVTPGYIDGCSVPSGETVTFLAVRLQFPPLEDLYQDAFWEEIRKELKDNPKGLPFEFGIEFSSPRVQGDVFPSRARLTTEVTIKLRNEKEMALIDQWYQNTPKEFFPKIVERQYLLKVPSLGLDEQVKRMLSPRDRLWYFLTFGNRYPGDPNHPTTWQGWWQLEQSITPSTMRDEIRLTRILIQYCTTKNKKVLDELKDWFAGMNEVQRTVMAKSIRDRARNCYGTDALLVPFRDLYHAIREYDTTAKSEREVDWLKQLGLFVSPLDIVNEEKNVNPILFADGFSAFLHGLCFVLAAFCGYFIARHFRSINHKSSGFGLSVAVGTAIGILLILDVSYFHPSHFQPQYERILIGIAGACLGFWLFRFVAKRRL